MGKRVLMGFNLDDYEPVAVRLARFLDKYPNGAIHTEIVYDDATRVVMKATAWRDMADPMPAGVDYAEELLTDRGVNSTSRIENCATSATGRVIALLGFAGTDWTKKPSREEMVKVARIGNGSVSVADNASASARAGGTVGVAAGSGSYATPKQMAFIRRLAADRGFTEEHAIQSAVDDVLGVATLLSQLSPSQASRIIETWRS
jgi:hypothetical protein